VLPAFAKIANPGDGRVPVRWRMVACNTPGPVRRHYRELVKTLVEQAIAD